jgi:3-deoxy-manno-octulosonate cytidylyltransferase (CMP-KDO synthetase)
MRTIAVVPARFRSERLPGKVLADIAGRPMVEHVVRRAAAARLVEEVLVATDDRRVLEAVSAFGGKAVLTSPDHPSGTDRVAEAVAGLEVDLVVNVQGDEPLLDPRAIDEAVETCIAGEERFLATLKRRIRSPAEVWDPNVVKVVTDCRGFALYFSRWPIPFAASASVEALNRGSLQPALEIAANQLLFRHVGLYVYPKKVLMELVARPPTPLERAERLEQLRALEYGFPILVGETEYESLSVDTAADLERARAAAQEVTANDPGFSR